MAGRTPETWQWDRSDSELSGLYQALVADRVAFLRIVVAVGVLMTFEITMWVLDPSLVGSPQIWLLGLVWACAAYLGVRGPLLRLRGGRLQRRLERYGFGIPRVITVRRHPWGLEVASEDGNLQAAWAALPDRPTSGFWIGPGFFLPDRLPVPALFDAPDEPPPLPDPPEGTAAWTYDRRALIATRRASGAVDWRMTVGISVVVLLFVAFVTAVVVVNGGATPEYALYATAVLLWRLAAHGWQWWRSIRAGRLSRPKESRVAPDGLLSGVPGLVRTVTPWTRIRRRRQIGGFTFFQTASGEWHMVPESVVPDEVGDWLRAGQEARRAARGGAARSVALPRANPFEPPS